MLRYSVYIWVNLLILIDCATSAEYLGPPASDFKRHSIVLPVVQHARTKRNIITTKDESGAHHPMVTVRISVDDEQYILDLQLNQDLVTDNHVLRYKKNGTTVLHKPTMEEIDFCHYHGAVRDKLNSRVALSTCHGLQGILFDGKRMRYIEPVQGHDLSSKHYIYDHADLTETYKCGHVNNETNNSNYDAQHNYHANEKIDKSILNRYKRYASDNKFIRGPYNENKRSRYVELVLVADHREFRKSGNNLRAVHRRMNTLANIINSVYAPLNIFIALVGVVVWTEGDEIQLQADGDQSLRSFLEYRKRLLVHDIPNDNSHLITRQKFTDNIIGKALVEAMCSYESSGGVENFHSTVIGLVASTVAHEMGHNFGMHHDIDQQCECPDEMCIMSQSSTSLIPIHWSSCSLSSLEKSFNKGLDHCLRNKPKRLFDSPTCGNGFVEPGEQCDCGTMAVAGSYSPCHACCDPATCMLRPNATCGAGMCCDLQTCRPKSAGTTCRSAERECDLPEYCTGDSEDCPEDVYKMDTTPCGKGKQSAYCVRGQCRTHTDQCRLIWGISGTNADQLCYESSNQLGDESGHCGYDQTRGIYRRCRAEDVMCGVLKCSHLTTDPEIIYKKIYTQQIILGDTSVQCYNVELKVLPNEDTLSMVPDGAKCGDGKMCLKQRCVSVADEREKIAHRDSSVCPSDCSGHGVCNSAGHCHCDEGYAPPLCAVPGPGGSFKSGPATDPAQAKKVMMAIYIIFLGIVPSMVIILCIACHFNPKALRRCSDTMQKVLVYCNFTKSSENTTQMYNNDKLSRITNLAVVKQGGFNHVTTNSQELLFDEPKYATDNILQGAKNKKPSKLQREINKSNKEDGITIKSNIIPNDNIHTSEENVNKGIFMGNVNNDLAKTRKKFTKDDIQIIGGRKDNNSQIITHPIDDDFKVVTLNKFMHKKMPKTGKHPKNNIQIHNIDKTNSNTQGVGKTVTKDDIRMVAENIKERTKNVNPGLECNTHEVNKQKGKSKSIRRDEIGDSSNIISKSRKNNEINDYKNSPMLCRQNKDEFTNETNAGVAVKDLIIALNNKAANSQQGITSTGNRDTKRIEAPRHVNRKQ